jgi:hypothetical protein
LGGGRDQGELCEESGSFGLRGGANSILVVIASDIRPTEQGDSRDRQGPRPVSCFR